VKASVMRLFTSFGLAIMFRFPHINPVNTLTNSSTDNLGASVSFFAVGLLRCGHCSA
jgi:hypothetical protein